MGVGKDQGIEVISAKKGRMNHTRSGLFGSSQKKVSPNILALSQNNGPIRVQTPIAPKSPKAYRRRQGGTKSIMSLADSIQVNCTSQDISFDNQKKGLKESLDNFEPILNEPTPKNIKLLREISGSIASKELQKCNTLCSTNSIGMVKKPKSYSNLANHMEDANGRVPKTLDFSIFRLPGVESKESILKIRRTLSEKKLPVEHLSSPFKHKRKNSINVNILHQTIEKVSKKQILNKINLSIPENLTIHRRIEEMNLKAPSQSRGSNISQSSVFPRKVHRGSINNLSYKHMAGVSSDSRTSFSKAQGNSNEISQMCSAKYFKKPSRKTSLFKTMGALNSGIPGTPLNDGMGTPLASGWSGPWVESPGLTNMAQGELTPVIIEDSDVNTSGNVFTKSANLKDSGLHEVPPEGIVKSETKIRIDKQRGLDLSDQKKFQQAAASLY